MSVLSISPTTTRKLVAAIVAFLLVSVAIVRTSDAAFSAQTSNEDNTFATGELSLAADTTAPLFGDQSANSAIQTDAVNLAPDDVRTGCIEITYTGTYEPGSLTEVSLAVSNANGDLVEHLDVRSDRTDTCDDPTDFTDLGNLAVIAGDSFETGWTPDGDGDSQAFHFEVTVGSGAEQDTEATDVNLTWSVDTASN